MDLAQENTAQSKSPEKKAQTGQGCVARGSGKNGILLTRQDVELAYSQSETMLKSYLQRQVSGKRISPGNANAQLYALRQGRAVMHLLADLGLTAEIVTSWLDGEMVECEKLAAYKEPFDPQPVITRPASMNQGAEVPFGT